jgi:hypothetical protein
LHVGLWCTVGSLQCSASESGTEADGAQASEAGVEAVVVYREDGKSEVRKGVTGLSNASLSPWNRMVLKRCTGQ